MIKLSSPAWLAMFALQARGDDDLRDGFHVRMLPSPLLGLPIAPWVIWQVPLSTIKIALGRGKTSLSHSVTIPIEPEDADRGELCYVAVEAVARTGVTKFSISLVNPEGGETLTTRSVAPYIVGGPVVRRVRLDGDIAGATLKVYCIYSKSFEGRGAKPITTLALPIDGKCRWYHGGITQKEGLHRVARGAPRRYSPLDQPDGPFDPLSDGDEVARIDAQRAEVDVALESVVRDPAVAPWDVVLNVDQPGINGAPSQYAVVPQLDSVLLPTCDPGFARYLGFVDDISKSIDKDLIEPLAGFIGAGLFAVDPERVVSQRMIGRHKIVERLKDRLPAVDAREGELIDLILAATGAKDVAEQLRKEGYQIRCFAAASAAVPQPDPLAAPQVSLVNAQWIAAASGVSVSFRQGFRLANTPFAPLMAMARSLGHEFEPRTRTVETGSLTRHIPLVVSEDDTGLGIASDAPVPAESAARYRFHLGDLFGRFGLPADVDVPDPVRPDPPIPIPRVAILRAVLDDQSPAALSPGSLDVRIPVPGNDSIGIGGRQIAKLSLSFAGETRTINVVPGSMVAEVFALPPLLPLQSGEWQLAAHFIDDSGGMSPDATQNIKTTDGRRPQPTPAGPGIIWTSRPGPSPDVELRLSWPGTPGQTYRAWLADQRGLGLAAGATRADVALDGFNRQQNGQLNGLAERFRLLTDDLIPTGADGQAVLATTLPRALQSVCFLRIVPETNGGVQAEFDACGLVPVAVPNDLRPPIPRLAVAFNSAGQPELTIEAVGFDMTAIAAMEPGLFTQPPSAANGPQYRLRRASGAVNDPLYARIIRDVTPLALDRTGAAPRFAAVFEDTASLLPFVRYTWWAEVRMPPERRLPAGAILLPTPGAITAENAAQTQDTPAPFSLLSAPATVVNAPSSAPAALDPDTITATIAASGGAFQLQLAIADVPVAHPQAVAPYRIRIWIQQGAAAPVSIDDGVETTTSAFVWQGPIAAADAGSVYVTVVDPLGRESAAVNQTLAG
jgi:hypothetical protein